MPAVGRTGGHVGQSWGGAGSGTELGLWDSWGGSPAPMLIQGQFSDHLHRCPSHFTYQSSGHGSDVHARGRRRKRQTERCHHPGDRRAPPPTTTVNALPPSLPPHLRPGMAARPPPGGRHHDAPPPSPLRPPHLLLGRCHRRVCWPFGTPGNGGAAGAW